MAYVFIPSSCALVCTVYVWLFEKASQFAFPLPSFL
jgi:hypothetical protein